MSWGTAGPPRLTNIPNDDTNLNAGPLPGGAIYLTSNPLYSADEPTESPKMRDPLTLAVSADGLSFGRVGVVMSCTTLGGGSSCLPRQVGASKNRGQV
jgi:hypothetical protein